MSKIVDRELGNSQIRLSIDGVEKTLDLDDKFFDGLPSKKIIRIRNEEYEFIPKVGELFTHFNLQVSNHVVGEIYILPRIIEQGYFDGKNEKLPLLSFKDVYYTECVEVKESLKYDDLSDKDFEYSLKNVKNVFDLKYTIINRYSRSMPALSREEIIDLGVSKTTLKILGKI